MSSMVNKNIDKDYFVKPKVEDNKATAENTKPEKNKTDLTVEGDKGKKPRPEKNAGRNLSGKESEKKKPKKSARVLSNNPEDISSLIEEDPRFVREAEDTGLPFNDPFEQDDTKKYFTQISQQPIDSLTEQLEGLYSAVKEGNDLTEYEIQQAQAVSYALSQKHEAINSGKYDPEEDIAEKLDSAKQMLNKILGSYKH